MPCQELQSEIIKIEKKLNEDLIGQKQFLNKLCQYFKHKISIDEKGIIFLLGEKETSKKTSIRLLFEYLQKVDIIENKEVDEIDLSAYNFNLGYNAFLTDLHEKLGSPSLCVLFKNIEKASEETLGVLRHIYPNTCLNLNSDYVVKNKFLVEANKNDKNKVNQIVCHNKFLVFTSNNEDFDIENVLGQQFTSKVDVVLHTKKLDKHERNIILKKEVLKTVKRLENDFKVKIVLDVSSNEDEKEAVGICKFLQESYKKDYDFGIYEYISYKLYKPLKNLMVKEQIEAQTTIIIYVENNEIYCKSDLGVFYLNNYAIPTLEEAKYKLNAVIGMKELKDFIDNIKNNYRVQKIRQQLGLKTSNISMNMIFAGNAGTGKTNAARITYEYLNALGVLSTGAYQEVSKADFVTENIAETAKRTNDIINASIGGVLFIDEAYSLCESEEDKVGKEIIDALLKGVEDNREELIVILAGYEKDMEKFLSFNPGLKSRFPNVIHFEDYSPAEMVDIAVNIAKSKGYKIANNVKSELVELFTKNQIIGKNDLGNARFVRNIVENAILDASRKYLTHTGKQIDLLEKDNFNFKAKTKFDLEKKLNEIIGLAEVKKLLRNQYKLIVAQEKRKSAGVNTKIDQNLNMVFTGNPGTGKTSVARLVAEMLNSMGLLKVGQLIETDRSSFVSEMPGETARKTEEKFKQAIGGILFIDEAYTLASDSLGIEAVETLLKLIEDYSKDVIVILAGYEEEMESFFDVNIGLRSRFPLWTNFEDYNPNELLEMAIRLIKSKGFKLSKNANVALKNSFVYIYEKSDSQSGNGRMVRNYVENLIRNQSIRIAENDISVYEMSLITTKDIEQINVSAYENEFNLEERLDRLIYNEEAKEFLRNQHKLIKIQERREKLGLRNDINKYRNIIFTGNIGTGKKTILTILSELYYSRGIIKAKSVVEMDISQIVDLFNRGEKLEDAFNNCFGKIVLIDKVHLLPKAQKQDEIITGFIKFMDKNINNIIFVLSGEKEGITNLIATNGPLSYRFPVHFAFEDYGEKELTNITVSILEDKGFSLSDEAQLVLQHTIIEFYHNKTIHLKNGLMIKNYLDQLIRTQSVRVYDEKVSPKDLNTIKVEDIYLSKKEFLAKNEFIYCSFDRN